jgi:hypothetical protein
MPAFEAFDLNRTRKVALETAKKAVKEFLTELLILSPNGREFLIGTPQES